MFRMDKDLYVYQSSMWQTNSVVYLNEAAKVIVDPTYFPVEVKVIANAARRHRAFNKYLLFTHSDFDHIVGHQLFKDYKLVGHHNFVIANRNEQIEQLAELDETYYITREEPFCFPELDILVEKDTVLPLAGDELVLTHAPGHTKDGLFIISRAKKLLISGDYISDLEFPFVYDSFASYLATLIKAKALVAEYDLQTVIPGHGDFADGEKEINYRIDTDIKYLRELLERVEDCCSKGLSSSEAQEVVRDMAFRGEKITGALSKLHTENVKKALEEINYGGREE